MQICFFGDSFTYGVGDPAGLGWRGRVVRRLIGVRPDVTAYDLGIRRNTSADILLLGIRGTGLAGAGAKAPAGVWFRNQ